MTVVLGGLHVSTLVEQHRRGFYNLARRLYAEETTYWRQINFYRKYFKRAEGMSLP